MKIPLPSDPQPEHAHHVCNMCGKPSEITICDECSERLRMEALARAVLAPATRSLTLKEIIARNKSK